VPKRALYGPLFRWSAGSGHLKHFVLFLHSAG